MVRVLDKILVSINISGHKDAQCTTSFYPRTEPGFDVKLNLKISISVKERSSVWCVLFVSGQKFYDGTVQKTFLNKRTCH